MRPPAGSRGMLIYQSARLPRAGDLKTARDAAKNAELNRRSEAEVGFERFVIFAFEV